MNPATVLSSEGVKTQTSGWGYPFIPDISVLWGKYRTSSDEFDKADGFDVPFPLKPDVVSITDITDIPGPEYEVQSVGNHNQVRSCLHVILEENANLKGKRDRNTKQRQDKVGSSKQNEPTRRSNRLLQKVPTIEGEGSKADTMEMAMRCGKKRVCISHHSEKLKSKSLQALDNIKLKAFSQPHVCLEKIVIVSHSDSTPQRFNCPHCTKTCTSKHHLQAHLVAKHNPSPLLCKFCGKLFGTEASIKKHQAYQEACKKAQQAFSQKRKK